MGDLNRYLRGEMLFGDDFDDEEIARWYVDEKEAYAALGAKDIDSYEYGYHAWNMFHAYRYLPDRLFGEVLGFGSAYGDELIPIVGRAGAVTIVDPSESFANAEGRGVKADYVKPGHDGTLPMATDRFDLITCFGVLHHIPNVSFVMSELARVLRQGGYLILREPIVSMGDWRLPRRGLTKRERGIPLPLMRRIIASTGLSIVRESPCGFPLVPRVFGVIGKSAYNSAFGTRVDALLAITFAWNINYHATSLFRKVRPTSAYFLLRKNALPHGHGNSAQ